MKKITIYTDGSCLGNGYLNNFGGYCGYIQDKDGTTLLVSGSEHNTTNNRMELKGVIESIKKVKKISQITLRSDSKIIVDAINTSLEQWRKNNWKNGSKKPVANKDLWEEYTEVSNKHQIKAEWIKAHSGDKYNELCDATAMAEAKKLKKAVGGLK